LFFVRLLREPLVDRVRNRYWRHDMSPVREQQRRQSIVRSIAREQQRTGWSLHEQTQAPTRTLRQTPTRSVAQQLQELAARLGVVCPVPTLGGEGRGSPGRGKGR
jgi:hypothetical protein